MLRFVTALVLVIGTACTNSIAGDVPRLNASYSGPAAVRLGDTAALAVRVSNSSGTAFSETLGGPPEGVVFTVRRADGTLVWQSDVGYHTPIAMNLRLSPGEDRELSTRWDLRDNTGALISPGAYYLSAVILRADGSILVADPQAHRIDVM